MDPIKVLAQMKAALRRVDERNDLRAEAEDAGKDADYARFEEHNADDREVIALLLDWIDQLHAFVVSLADETLDGEKSDDEGEPYEMSNDHAWELVWATTREARRLLGQPEEREPALDAPTARRGIVRKI